MADVMNAVDAADFLGIHVETLRKLARRNEVPCFKVGRDWRFRREALVSWADEQRPLDQAPAPGPAQVAPSSASPRRSDAHPLSVLIVDDEPPVCRMLTHMVQRQGAEARHALSGAQGLELVQQQPPDVVLLDLMMPEMNGPQFLERLRQHHPGLPVVLVTGYPDSRLVGQALAFAPIMLLAKPVNPALLGRTMETLTGGRTARIER